MKISNIILLSVFILSCASDNAVKFDGLERVESSTSPSVVYLDSFAPKKNSRAPASAVEVPTLSNRQVYFLSFYKQYLQVGEIVGVKSTLRHCPSFHQVVLDYKEGLETSQDEFSQNMNFTAVAKNQEHLSYFPVLALDYGFKRPLYWKLQADNWEDTEGAIQSTMAEYHQNMKVELNQLCDSGVSAGYYVYENLVTYFKEYKDFHHTREGLKALLKVPTLANMVLVDNFNQRPYYLSQENIFNQWLLARANTTWFKDYLNYVHQKRTEVLKTELQR